MFVAQNPPSPRFGPPSPRPGLPRPRRLSGARAGALALLVAAGLVGCDCSPVSEPHRRSAPRPGEAHPPAKRRAANRTQNSDADQKRQADPSRVTPRAEPRPAPRRVAALAAAQLTRTPLARRVRALYLGKPARHANLTLIPVEADFAGLDRRVLTVDAAFAANKMEVSEQGSATVPFIKVKKPRSDEVFIMTGEMFVGARQDRIAKHDVLLPRRAGTFRLPVYCVEQGRWGGGSRFTTGKALSTRSLRKSAAKKRSQSKVWGKVRAKTGNVRARTSTQTMAASYKSAVFRKKSPPYLKALGRFAAKRPAAVGVLVVINGTVSNLDLFANHDLFEKLWEKLLKASVLDAVDPRFEASEFDGDKPRHFLATLPRVKYKRTRTPGLGKEYLLSSDAVAGTLLVAQRRLVHLALFPEKESDGKAPTRRFHSDRRQAPRVHRAPTANRRNTTNRPPPRHSGTKGSKSWRPTQTKPHPRKRYRKRSRLKRTRRTKRTKRTQRTQRTKRTQRYERPRRKAPRQPPRRGRKAPSE